MALHKHLWTMAVEGIGEYLTASRMSLDHRKSDGGCLGYPATLLLLCVVNALGTYLQGDDVMIEKKTAKITRGEPFRVLNHTIFGLNLRHKEVKLIEQSYRNRLAHNAIIERGSSMILSENDPPFVFPSGHVEIRVLSLYRSVEQAWDRFPKERIQDWERRQRNSK